MADPVVRRDQAEVGEGLLAPTEEAEALGIAVELDAGIDREGVRTAGDVDDDRVVHDQVDRDERVHRVGLAAERCDGVTHRGEVDDRRARR